MGTLYAIRQDSAATLAQACGAFLATLDYLETRGTRKAYASTLRALRAEFGGDADTAGLDALRVGAWFTALGRLRARHVQQEPGRHPVRSEVLARSGMDDHHRPDRSPAPPQARR